MNILAVIPARGGSKGIPRKNIRLMHKKPLIYYAIHNAQSCAAITDVAVSTDDEEIAAISARYGAEVLARDAELARDATTLDPVIYDATLQMEAKRGIAYDVVITLQPTSPLLSADTLSQAITSFLASGCDTYISASNQPHLAWSKGEDGTVYPLYHKRLNRQQLPPNYVEAGAFFITKRQFVVADSRMGKSISVFEIPENEAVDIDTTADWIVCEQRLGRKKIVFRADGYRQLGMGHIYHCLTLAYNLTGHEVMFVTSKEHTEGLEKIRQSHFPYHVIESDAEFFKFLGDYRPDVVVNDCLDTSARYIQKLKELVPRVVTIEDLGEGSRYADAVINALYENLDERKNVYSGKDYVCLRDEFVAETAHPVREQVKNILIVFGGADPANLTAKMYRLATRYNAHYHTGIRFVFMTGSAYDCEANGVVTREDKNVCVLRDVKRVTTYMHQADLAVTSQGRTVFELACMGVPAIVMAQNEREQLHTFAQMSNGFLNLGLGTNVSEDTLEKTLNWLINTPAIRREMQQLMLRHDLQAGIERVKKLILEDTSL